MILPPFYHVLNKLEWNRAGNAITGATQLFFDGGDIKETSLSAVSQAID